MIVSLWTFCFGMLTPPLLGIWGTLGLDPPSFSCTILKKDDSSPKKFLFLFGFLFPCIAIVVSYTAIYYKVDHVVRMEYLNLDLLFIGTKCLLYFLGKEITNENGFSYKQDPTVSNIKRNPN